MRFGGAGFISRSLSILLVFALASSGLSAPHHHAGKNKYGCPGQLWALFQKYGRRVPENAEPNPVVAFFATQGIAIREKVGDLRCNGGLPIDPNAYRDWLDQRDHSEDNRFERTAARFFSRRGEKFLGWGDDSVRNVLIPGRWDKEGHLVIKSNSGADLLSYYEDPKDPSKSGYIIRECKNHEGSSLGITKAAKQLGSTARELLRRVPNAHILRLEVVVPEQFGGDLVDLSERYELVHADVNDPDVYLSTNPERNHQTVTGIDFPIYVHFIPKD